MNKQEDIEQKLKEAFKDEPLSYPDLEKYYIETKHHMGSEKNEAKSIFSTSDNYKIIVGETGIGKTTSLRKTLTDLKKKDYITTSINAPAELTLDEVLKAVLEELMKKFRDQDPDFPILGEELSIKEYELLLKGRTLQKEKGNTVSKALKSTINGFLAKIGATKSTSESEKTVVISNKITIEEKKKLLAFFIEHICGTDTKLTVSIDHIFIENNGLKESKLSNLHETIREFMVINDKAKENLPRAETNEKILFLFSVDTDLTSEALKDTKIGKFFEILYEMDYINLQEAVSIVTRRLNEAGLEFQDIFTSDSEFEKIYDKSGRNPGKLIKLTLEAIIQKINS